MPIFSNTTGTLNVNPKKKSECRKNCFFIFFQTNSIRICFSCSFCIFRSALKISTAKCPRNVKTRARVARVARVARLARVARVARVAGVVRVARVAQHLETSTTRH
jgi:hypothetical protein